VDRARAGWSAFVDGGLSEAFRRFWTEHCVFEDFPEMPDAGALLEREAENPA
jgi:hypothetical protein